MAPYSYTADNLQPLASHLQEINYAFLYFCPPPGTNPLPYWAQPPFGSCTDATAFQLMSVEPSDAAFLKTITGYRAQNPGLSVMLSIGGWNFFSSYWSAMAATPTTRATFIQSCKDWLSQTGADGIDVDWEYPCSPARTDPVEITCTDVSGPLVGNCPSRPPCPALTRHPTPLPPHSFKPWGTLAAAVPQTPLTLSPSSRSSLLRFSHWANASPWPARPPSLWKLKWPWLPWTPTSLAFTS